MPIITRLYEGGQDFTGRSDVRQKLIAGGNNIVASDTQEFHRLPGGESRSGAWVVRAGNIKRKNDIGRRDRGIAGQGSDRIATRWFSTR